MLWQIREGMETMDSYIQFLNMGMNTNEQLLPVQEWNVDYAVMQALRINKEQKGMRLIGFRFVEKEGADVIGQSGIYYLEGEIIQQPQEDPECYQYFRERDLEIPMFPVIKLKVPFLIIYPYEDEDRMVSMERYENQESEGYQLAEKEALRMEIKEYKENLISEMMNVVEALQAEEFSLIPLSGEQREDGKRYLNLCGDQGDFGSHIRYLHEQIQRWKKM